VVEFDGWEDYLPLGTNYNPNRSCRYGLVSNLQIFYVTDAII